MKNKKLLMLSTDRLIFREGSAVRERMAKYAEDWDELHIIVFTKKSRDREIKEHEYVIGQNCYAYPTRSSFKWMYPIDAMRLGRFIISRRHMTNITCEDPSLTAMAGIALRNEFHIPLEIQIHGDIGSTKYTFNMVNKIRKMMAIKYIGKADSIRVVSGRIKDYLVKQLNIPEELISIRPVFVDTEAIKNFLPIENIHNKYPQFQKIVLMASRLEKEKNIPLAIKAFAPLIAKGMNLGLIIVGEGKEKRKLQNLIERLHIENNVFIEPWANRERLISYYKTADLFLNTSLFEGYGMTMVEAHAANCPIISTDVGVAKELGASVIADDQIALQETLHDFFRKQ